MHFYVARQGNFIVTIFEVHAFMGKVAEFRSSKQTLELLNYDLLAKYATVLVIYI